MGKTIIEFIPRIINITGDTATDIILFFTIGCIAFNVAWGFVGRLFDFLGFYDSDLMSNVHWFVRAIVFISLTWFAIKVIQFFTWIFSFQWWVYLIAIVSLLFIILNLYIVKYITAKKRRKDVTPEPPKKESNIHTKKALSIDTKVDNQEMSKPIVDMRYFCPRCGASLVKRQGPYGYFWGCNAYPKTGCRYTRKHL